MEALAPFRAPFERPAGDPQPLPYLDSPANRERGALDITLEVWLQTAQMREAGQPAVRLTRGNTTQAAYWTAAQLVAHHTVNGCNLQPGDLLGTGTLSGPEPERGRLAARAHAGRQAADHAAERRDAHLPGRRRHADPARLVRARGRRAHRARRSQRDRRAFLTSGGEPAKKLQC